MVQLTVPNLDPLDPSGSSTWQLTMVHSFIFDTWIKLLLGVLEAMIRLTLVVLPSQKSISYMASVKIPIVLGISYGKLESTNTHRHPGTYLN
ncbi:unnamed protein product [Ambrosiozyma monospora]|uniref:Unnamed protein product n=1 Tax=Ambrosiozyma monospora TaxID=43982 RepID=A0A9W6YQ50_AMBMO|nr:unnamed protein product [Ambrosiozyma monospora]